MITISAEVDPKALEGLVDAVQQYGAGLGKTMTSSLAKAGRLVRVGLYKAFRDQGNQKGQVIRWAQDRQFKNIKGSVDSKSSILAEERTRKVMLGVKSAYFHKGDIASGGSTFPTPAYKSKPAADGTFSRVLTRAPKSANISLFSRMLKPGDRVGVDTRSARTGSAGRGPRANARVMRGGHAVRALPLLQPGLVTRKSMTAAGLVLLNYQAVKVANIVRAREAARGYSAQGFLGVGRNALPWKGDFPDAPIVTLAGKNRRYVIGSVIPFESKVFEQGGAAIMIENLSPGAAKIARRSSAITTAVRFAATTMVSDLKERLARQIIQLKGGLK